MTRIINDGLDEGQIPTVCRDLYSGMHSPKVATLTGGVIYKFASSKRSPAQQVASPWWFTDVEFQKITKYLALDPGNKAFIARIQAGVKYEWSELDTLVTATIKQPIRVFMGPGANQCEQTKAGSTILFQPPPDLLQTYIPNIVNGAGPSLNTDGMRALGDFDFMKISSGDAIDDAINNLKGKTVVLVGNPSLH